jgi:hypothetical protein
VSVYSHASILAETDKVPAVGWMDAHSYVLGPTSKVTRGNSNIGDAATKVP